MGWVEAAMQWVWKLLDRTCCAPNPIWQERDGTVNESWKCNPFSNASFFSSSLFNSISTTTGCVSRTWSFRDHFMFFRFHSIAHMINKSKTVHKASGGMGAYTLFSLQEMKNYDWCRCGCWIRLLSNPESQKGKSKARAAVYRILWEFYWKTFFYRSLLRWAMSWFDRMKMNYDRWKFYTTFFQSNFGLEFQVSHESGISFNLVCRSIPSVC